MASTTSIRGGFVPGTVCSTPRRCCCAAGEWRLSPSRRSRAFPQLETVVRQQSVDPIPAGVPSFQSFDRMGTAFGEKGAKTTVFIAMENRGGLTPTVRARYDELVQELRGTTADVASARDLVGGSPMCVVELVRM